MNVKDNVPLLCLCTMLIFMSLLFYARAVERDQLMIELAKLEVSKEIDLCVHTAKQ